METVNNNLMEEGDNIDESQGSGRSKGAIPFIKRHSLEIVLGVGCTVLSIAYMRQGNANALRDKLKDNVISQQNDKIKYLIDLCEEKDAWFKELMSDALRHRSSFAGKCMVDRREMLGGR